MLLTLLLIPILTALGVMLRPARQAALIATIGSTAAFAWSLLVWRAFDFESSAAMQLTAAWTWIQPLGLRLSLGVDSIALLLVMLTAGLTPLAILGSWTAITQRVREFYLWMLILEAAMLGVFVARDLLVFYIAFEFTLIPMYFLIAVYGSTNRARASIVFFLYTFTGSIITLVGLLYVAWAHWDQHGQWTLDIASLTATASSMSTSQQAWVLLALCCGFAVKVPLFPVHTWLPLAHTEAPTAGSVILAAVLLKLGTYGLYRFAMPMCPAAFHEYAPLIAALCIVGIIYGALVCWVQRDMKRLIAYSSVSHLGFCVLGLAAVNAAGVGGSVMYMINHGLSTGALFFCIGMVYERFHTRSLDELGGLARRMPVWTMFTIFFVLSSVGLPGLNGFVGEFLTFFGAFTSGQPVQGLPTGGPLGPWYGSIAAVGMILAAIYLLYFAGYLIFGTYHLPDTSHDAHDAHDDHARVRLPRDLSLREVVVLAPLALLCFWLGVQPGAILSRIEQPVSGLVTHVHAAAERSMLITAIDDSEGR